MPDMKFTALLRVAVCVEVCVEFTGAYIYIYRCRYIVSLGMCSCQRIVLRWLQIMREVLTWIVLHSRTREVPSRHGHLAHGRSGATAVCGKDAAGGMSAYMLGNTISLYESIYQPWVTLLFAWNTLLHLLLPEVNWAQLVSIYTYTQGPQRSYPHPGLIFFKYVTRKRNYLGGSGYIRRLCNDFICRLCLCIYIYIFIYLYIYIYMNVT